MLSRAAGQRHSSICPPNLFSKRIQTNRFGKYATNRLTSKTHIAATSRCLSSQLDEKHGFFDGGVWEFSLISRTCMALAAIAGASYYRNHDTDSEGSSAIASAESLASPLIATSASAIRNDRYRTNNSNDIGTAPSIFLEENEKASEEADFVIVGYGNAGQAAAKVLKAKCPNATIIVVNPNPNPNPIDNTVDVDVDDASTSVSRGTSSKGKGKGLLQHLTGSAINFNHSNKTLDVFASGTATAIAMHTGGSQSRSPRLQPKMKRISYKHSIIICSGVRGAPPPSSLIDERATERILELRSTQLPSLNQYILQQTLSGVKVGDHGYIYPIMPKQSVRDLAMMAASQGAKICIMGSDFEAVELAASLSLLAIQDDDDSKAKNQESNGNGNGNRNRNSAFSRRFNNNNNNNICMTFGGAAPLGATLPRYLSTAVSKRLRAHGIDISDRTLVRYISYSDPAPDATTAVGNVEVHMAKSYDTLDTKRYTADLVVVAPRVVGPQGSAAIPNVATATQSFSPKLSFHPWSKLSPVDVDESVISCYSDDGRIVVNAELSAASNVYAAGSAAKYPNHATGHATVAGEGPVDGSLAGKIAAENMVRDYNCNERGRVGSNTDLNSSSKSKIYSKKRSLPLVRTDQLSTIFSSDQKQTISGLSALGIRALCIGQCDSETCSSHGFFWTNQSRRLTRRRTLGGAGNEKVNKTVYGPGIVFYLDRAGTIRGIMLWGLPFTKSGKDGGPLNELVLDRMKGIINTNGQVMLNDHKKAIEKMRLDPALLCPSHLAEESMSLASLAFSTLSAKQRRLPRPLHRYLPSKPISITSIGTLKKSAKIGTGTVGEDIFERAGHDLGFYEGERSRHPSLVHYFNYDWSSMQPISLDGDESGEDSYNESMHSIGRSSKNPDNAARPPKEEPLWLRKNEEARMHSREDRLAEAFMYNIRRGHFSDGTDSVKQAPTPKMITDAKQEYKKWVGDSDDDSEEE